MRRAFARIEDDVAGALEALADALGGAQVSPNSGGERRPRPPPGNSIPRASAPRSPRCNPKAPSSWMKARRREVRTERMSRWRAAAYESRADRRRDRTRIPVRDRRGDRAPDRPRVIGFQADGSGMYTVQALWTQAREQLNVTTVLCSNRAYRILQMEAARAGSVEMGRKTRSLTMPAPPKSDGLSSRKGSAFRVCASRPQMIW